MTILLYEFDSPWPPWLNRMQIGWRPFSAKERAIHDWISWRSSDWMRSSMDETIAGELNPGILISGYPNIGHDTSKSWVHPQMLRPPKKSFAEWKIMCKSLGTSVCEHTRVADPRSSTSPLGHLLIIDHRSKICKKMCITKIQIHSSKCCA